MKVAKKFTVSGRVQGVGFRFFAHQAANELGVIGYVKNKWNGSVEAYGVGEPTQLQEFKRMLTQGPRSARVENVEESDEAVDPGYKKFVIE